ncbi:hypothetical protein GCM10010425_68310 [Streptomyces spororaveus]|uniref:Uncharacterized protein n=1 Tax=Streptomyces spororaveus TaxID=284039 RepID=A0ABQ3T350_9ACTN|nr:hypothetical protein Sspor_03780 [Streptomyces spororaveus]
MLCGNAAGLTAVHRCLDHGHPESEGQLRNREMNVSTPIRRWLWGSWAALVLVGGATTLYLEEPAADPAGPYRWERSSEPPRDPTPCPSTGSATRGNLHGCSSWQRG